MTKPWPAPRAHAPVQAVVDLPGSKSLTNRALIIAALADAPATIRRPLRARDTLLMAAALRSLGVSVDDAPDGWRVTPAPLHGGVVDVGLAGTIMRFVPPLAGLARGEVRFDGDPAARERPMRTLIDALRQAGVTIDDGDRGRLPFTVLGTGSVPGGTVHIDASASSQFVSGLLLAGARFDKGIEVVHAGDGPVPSLPHIQMTVECLREGGVDVEQPSPSVWQIGPGAIRARDVQIEPDLSNAAPFLAAALVSGGQVRIPDWPSTTSQAGDRLRQLMADIGASVSLDAGVLAVHATGQISGIDADLRDVSELTPVLAALAALASSPSSFRGIGHIRGHETDRIAALAAEINRLGGDAEATTDGLVIRPRRLHGGTWHAYADHRMAQAGAVIGLAVDGVLIDDIGSTTKTLADFPGMWAGLLGDR